MLVSADLQSFLDIYLSKDTPLESWMENKDLDVGIISGF